MSDQSNFSQASVPARKKSGRRPYVEGVVRSSKVIFRADPQLVDNLSRWAEAHDMTVSEACYLIIARVVSRS